MPWKDNSGSGGPWGSGNNGGKPRGPWGGNNNNNGPGNRGPFQPPKFEDMLRKGGDRMKGMLPGGVGSPRGVLIIALLAILGWLATGLYRVNPNEAGIELVFGRMTNLTRDGLNWNWPSPIGEVVRPGVTTVRQTPVGFVSGGRVGQSRPVDNESLMLTGDENIIDVQATILWRIDWDPTRVREGQAPPGVRNYVFNIRNPDQTVKDASEAALRDIVGRKRFEIIRTSGRAEIEGEAQRLIQQMLDQYGAGVFVVQVQLQKIDPPPKVLDAFRDVQAARADSERLVNESNAYRNRVVQGAQGEAQRIEQAGEAFKQERIAIAEGDSRRFLSVYEQYKSAKDITRQRIYLETMRDLLRSMDKTLVDKNSGALPWLSLDPSRPGTTTVPRPAAGDTR